MKTKLRIVNQVDLLDLNCDETCDNSDHWNLYIDEFGFGYMMAANNEPGDYPGFKF